MNWLLLLLLACCCCLLGGEARKTAKEWNAYKAKLDYDEDIADVRSENDNKPGILSATFAAHVEEHERLITANKWTGQLQSVGVKINVFDSGDEPNKWIITTNGNTDLVWKYFKRHIVEMPQLVRVDNDQAQKTLWNVPTHQQAYLQYLKETGREEEDEL